MWRMNNVSKELHYKQGGDSKRGPAGKKHALVFKKGGLRAARNDQVGGKVSREHTL